MKNLGKKIVNGIKKMIPITKKVAVASKVNASAADKTLSITDKVDRYIKTNGRSSVDDWIAHERNISKQLSQPR